DYMFADCLRDKRLAENYGFKGQFLGVFPGGGGYDLAERKKLIKPIDQRNTILIKGYQGRSGRSLTVIDALENIKDDIAPYKIIIFGADIEVEKAVRNSSIFQDFLTVEVLPISQLLPHNDILKLMGEALIYIGNSNSDGMPNTLLEAIIMGAFPIQSNPGNATEEIIEHGKNGLVINDFNNSNEIAALITKALYHNEMIKNAFDINQSVTKYKFERNKIASKVKQQYSLVGKS
ncbi:MAG: glycosyltransferase, partial [Winogradskyella sp.]|nr:glycosyltransferase [Winogradskyella sp.]